MRQAEDHLVDAGKAGRLEQLLRLGLLEAADVLADRAREQLDILRQVTDEAAEMAAVPEPDVGAVDADEARAGAENARGEL
jgi:hypothetical protein